MNLGNRNLPEQEQKADVQGENVNKICLYYFQSCKIKKKWASKEMACHAIGGILDQPRGNCGAANLRNLVESTS